MSGVGIDTPVSARHRSGMDKTLEIPLPPGTERVKVIVEREGPGLPVPCRTWSYLLVGPEDRLVVSRKRQ